MLNNDEGNSCPSKSALEMILPSGEAGFEIQVFSLEFTTEN